MLCSLQSGTGTEPFYPATIILHLAQRQRERVAQLKTFLVPGRHSLTAQLKTENEMFSLKSVQCPVHVIPAWIHELYLYVSIIE